MRSCRQTSQIERTSRCGVRTHVALFGSFWIRFTPVGATQDSFLLQSARHIASVRSMTDPVAPPGWYPDEGDPTRKRWWTGTGWTSVTLPAYSVQQPSVERPIQEPPAQPSAHQAPAPRKRGLGCFGWLTIIVLVFGAVSIGGTVLAGLVNSNSAAPKPYAPEKPAEPVKSASQVRDEQATADGWSVIESGSLYGKFLDEGDYTCGNYRCSYYAVHAVDGCPTSLYVEANIVNENGVAVDMTNGVLGGLGPEQSGTVLLEDFQEAGSGFRITDVSCY